jgi:hypothetical protein
MGETNRIHNIGRRSKTTNTSFGGCKDFKAEVDKAVDKAVVDNREAVDKVVAGKEAVDKEGLPQISVPCNKEEGGNKEEVEEEANQEEEAALSC